MSRSVRTFTRGQSLTGPAFRTQLNDTVNAINALRQDAGDAGFTGFPASLTRMYLFTQFGPNDTTDQDWIVCTELRDDGTTPGTENVRIALPFLLRRTPFDGGSRAGISYTYTNNFTRSANDGSGAVEEIIVPSFEVGDVIFATEVYPHTRVREDATDGNSQWLTLLMENDGRMWSRDANSSGGT